MTPDPIYSVSVTPAKIVDGVPQTDRFDTRTVYRTVIAGSLELLDEQVRAIAAGLGQTCVTIIQLVDNWGEVDQEAFPKVAEALSVIEVAK